MILSFYRVITVCALLCNLACTVLYSDTFYTAEELLAMVLQDARNIVNGYAGACFVDLLPYL